MISLNDRLRTIAEAFGFALAETYHYEKPPKVRAPYAVWAEDGEPDSFAGDGLKHEQAISGTLDFYTLTEFDPLVDELQDVLAAQFGASWSLNSVQYEDETKLIHYSWDWEAH